MCWEGRLINRHVAKEDIQVYKILRKLNNGNLYSPYYYHEYHSETFYSLYRKLEVHNTVGDIINIDEGYHCFSGDCVFNSWKNEYGQSVRVFPPQSAYFSNSLLDMFYCMSHEYDYVIARCIIKEGTEYYENSEGEIVTEAILVKEIVKFSNISESKMKDL